MQFVPSGSKVLVTGANGYLAIWIVQRLLDRGYSVRGTVRSASKGSYLEEYFKSYADRLEVVVVSDFTKEGAFDKSLVGVSAVIHPATPLPSPGLKDPEDYIKPAVGGTLGILKSALQSPGIKRIVYTSTLGTVARQVTEPTVLTEKDWNEGAVQFVEEQGAKSPGQMKYVASKVLAEKAAWKFYEEHKKDLPYDFLVFNAPYIFGPGINQRDKESGSLGIWYNNCVAKPDDPRSDETLSESTPYVDVRDLADVHVSALEKDAAGGERFIIASGDITWQQWIDVANKVQSTVSFTHPLPKGKPGIASKKMISFDASKEARLIGTKYRTVEETVRDMLEQLSK
ncbi:D-lactaldehyde dehydrogenase [Cyathus striatus]|nr:D-lactaldehyde dehydrogenase [Cyathus striatus]